VYRRREKRHPSLSISDAAVLGIRWFRTETPERFRVGVIRSGAAFQAEGGISKLSRRFVNNRDWFLDRLRIPRHALPGAADGLRRADRLYRLAKLTLGNVVQQCY
jgi:hypothetical protein